jgi:DNA-binding NtrC family response regulator
MPQKILVIDDEKLIRWTLEQHLAKEGFEVATADSAEHGLELITDEQPDLVLLDNRLPGMTGLDLLAKLNVPELGLMVIMITAYGMVETAVKAMKLGAYDYISKPFNLEEITFVIKKALEAGSLRTQVKQLRQECKGRVAAIIGESPDMIKVQDLIVKIARSDATTVLIQGESGTGKELVAKGIHAGSARMEKPFMAINCAALPLTLLESELMGYEKGAFTDAKTAKKALRACRRRHALPPRSATWTWACSQLLRLLESKTFKRIGGVRTSRSTSASSRRRTRTCEGDERGQVRKDLYYRLQVVPITLRPARPGEDILLLANHFIGYFNKECHKNVKGISKDAADALMRYSGPGTSGSSRTPLSGP